MVEYGGELYMLTRMPKCSHACPNAHTHAQMLTRIHMYTGEFVIEYVGELIDASEARRRAEKSQQNFDYHFALSK